MELQFHKETIRCLRETVYDALYQEQTAEMTVPETLPEIGRIVDCFGTILVKTKTVENGAATAAGGIQAGVLYVPEGEQASLERIEVYIPFTVTKKIPAMEDPVLFYWGWLRSIDARFINPRKVLVRVNLGSELTLLSAEELQVSRLDSSHPGLACRESTYPMLLPRCAAEKELQIMDEVLIREQGPGADRLLKWTCAAEITESRVIGTKAVFKGSIQLRTLFANEAGEIGTWEGAVPFSQYAELDAEAEDGIVSVQPIFRHLEVDTDGQLDSRRLLLNATLTAQLLVRARVPITLTEDAYCLKGSFAPQWQTLTLNPLLDCTEETVVQTLDLPPEVRRVFDWTVLCDRPALTAGSREEVQSNLLVNLLYHDEDQNIQGKLLRQPLHTELMRTEGASCSCFPSQQGEVQIAGAELRIPMRFQCTVTKQDSYRTLCGGTVEEAAEEERPSLIVRRGKGQLWEIAKKDRSTVEAIKAANHLDTDELTEEQLLLIPCGTSIGWAKEDAV